MNLEFVDLLLPQGDEGGNQTHQRPDKQNWHEAEGFRILRTIRAPGGRGLLAISADGRLLATPGENESIRIWRVSIQGSQ
jgi:hypothetical protein